MSEFNADGFENKLSTSLKNKQTKQADEKWASLVNKDLKMTALSWTLRLPVSLHPCFTGRPVHCVFPTNIHSSIRGRGPHSCMINLLLMQKACTAHRWCPRRNDATDSFWGQNNQNVHQRRRCERVEMRVWGWFFFFCVCVCMFAHAKLRVRVRVRVHPG